MLNGHTEQEATEIYLLLDKKTIKVSDRLFFDKLCDRRFSCHTLAIMKSNITTVEKLFQIADELGIIEKSFHS